MEATTCSQVGKLKGQVSMDGVIDSYGLRAAHKRSVLDQLRDTDRLHVSPLTWYPGDGASIGSFATSITCGSEPHVQLTLVNPDGTYTVSRTAGLDARLHGLHGRGVLVLTTDHECDPQRVANVEGSWKDAGLVGRPTDETLTAVMTAERLGFDLITNDCDVRKFADYLQVHAMTVADFASALAA